jgi:hypothetical protein
MTLRVRIIDDLDLAAPLLAVVDAASTADALAYFLRTRADRLGVTPSRCWAVPGGTVAGRRAHARSLDEWLHERIPGPPCGFEGGWPGRLTPSPARRLSAYERLVYEEYNPATKTLEVSLIAEAVA